MSIQTLSSCIKFFHSFDTWPWVPSIPSQTALPTHPSPVPWATVLSAHIIDTLGSRPFPKTILPSIHTHLKIARFHQVFLLPQLSQGYFPGGLTSPLWTLAWTPNSPVQMWLLKFIIYFLICSWQLYHTYFSLFILHLWSALWCFNTCIWHRMTGLNSHTHHLTYFLIRHLKCYFLSYFNFRHSGDCLVTSVVVFLHISLMSNDVDHVLTHSLTGHLVTFSGEMSHLLPFSWFAVH
jgi:hypothetical protein